MLVARPAVARYLGGFSTRIGGLAFRGQHRLGDECLVVFSVCHLGNRLTRYLEGVLLVTGRE